MRPHLQGDGAALPAGKAEAHLSRLLGQRQERAVPRLPVHFGVIPQAKGVCHRLLRMVANRYLHHAGGDAGRVNIMGLCRGIQQHLHLRVGVHGHVAPSERHERLHREAAAGVPRHKGRLSGLEKRGRLPFFEIQRHRGRFRVFRIIPPAIAVRVFAGLLRFGEAIDVPMDKPVPAEHKIPGAEPAEGRPETIRNIGVQAFLFSCHPCPLLCCQFRFRTGCFLDAAP